MIDYGGPPAADEIEVTLFDPGYGEALAIHQCNRSLINDGKAKTNNGHSTGFPSGFSEYRAT